MTNVFIKTKDTFFGNNKTRVWPLSYPLLAVQQLRVIITNPCGVSAVADKHVGFDAENACVIYPVAESQKSPLADGWQISVERQAPLARDLARAVQQANMPKTPEDLTAAEEMERVEEIRAVKNRK